MPKKKPYTKKSLIEAKKDSWKEYIELIPSFSTPKPEQIFSSGFELGVEWAMMHIHGPHSKFFYAKQ